MKKKTTTNFHKYVVKLFAKKQNKQFDL